MSYKPDGVDVAASVVNWPFELAMKVWTFVVLWRWFIVPLGVRPLTMYQGFGLLLVWSAMTFGFARYKPDIKEESDYYVHLVAPYFACGILLLLGVLARGMFA